MILADLIAWVLVGALSGWVASKIMKTEYQKTFYTLSYAILPLFIIGGLSHILEFFLVHYASDILNGFNQGFSLGFGTIEPLVKRGERWLIIFNAFTIFSIIGDTSFSSNVLSLALNTML